jgi:mannan endo-1,4-beta-mannosidase
VLNNAAWDAIDYAFFMARQYNIRLIVPLLDAYEYFHGGYSSFCRSRNVAKESFWTNQQVRNDFKDYISKWLLRVNPYNNIQRRNDSMLLMIELGNELGNYRTDGNSLTIPTKEWITDITRYIKTIDSNHLVLSGSDECLGSTTSDDFNVPQLDAFSAHFYGSGSGDINRIRFGASNSARLRKPYLIGEYDSKNFPDSWFSTVSKSSWNEVSLSSLGGQQRFSFWQHGLCLWRLLMAASPAASSSCAT